MSGYECRKNSYILLRKSIKDGDILSTSGKKIIAKCIKWFTAGKGDFINSEKCEMNHVGMFIWVKTQLFIIEANWSLFGSKKVELVRFSKEYHGFKGRLFIIRPKISLGKERANGLGEFINNMVNLIGDPYDLEAAIRQISRKAKYKLNKKQYCSEAINFCRNNFYTDGKLKHIKPHELVMKEPNFKFEINQGTII